MCRPGASPRRGRPSGATRASLAPHGRAPGARSRGPRPGGSLTSSPRPGPDQHRRPDGTGAEGHAHRTERPPEPGGGSSVRLPRHPQARPRDIAVGRLDRTRRRRGRLRPRGTGRHPGRPAQRRPRRRRPRPGRDPRRHRRGQPRRLRGARRQRRRHGPPVRARGDQPRGRPSADPAPALAAQPRPDGHGDRRPRGPHRRGHRADHRRRRQPASILAVEARSKPGAKKRPPTPRHVPWAQLGPGRVQVEFGRSGADEDDLDGDAPDDDVEDDDVSQLRGGGQ